MTGSQLSPMTSMRWTDRFALDIALSICGSGDDTQTILNSHGLSPADLADFSKDPVFTRRVEEYCTNIKENGLTFKLKAKAQAEILLETSFDLIHDKDVSPAVKADLIKWTVKVAGLEPTGKETGVLGNAVVVNINLGETTATVQAQTPMRTVTPLLES